MEYTPHTWVEGELVSAEKMNRIENELQLITSTVTNDTTSLKSSLDYSIAAFYRMLPNITNAIKVSTIIPGYVINTASSGKPIKQSSYYYSNFIEISPSTKYYFSASNFFVSWYSSEDFSSFIRTNITDINGIGSPSTAHYAVLSAGIPNIANSFMSKFPTKWVIDNNTYFTFYENNPNPTNGCIVDQGKFESNSLRILDKNFYPVIDGYIEYDLTEGYEVALVFYSDNDENTYINRTQFLTSPGIQRYQTNYKWFRYFVQQIEPEEEELSLSFLSTIIKIRNTNISIVKNYRTIKDNQEKINGITQYGINGFINNSGGFESINTRILDTVYYELVDGSIHYDLTNGYKVAFCMYGNDYSFKGKTLFYETAGKQTFTPSSSYNARYIKYFVQKADSSDIPSESLKDIITIMDYQGIKESINKNIADEFIETEQYSSGKIISYQNGLYQLSAGHSSGQRWENTSKNEVIIGDKISLLEKYSDNKLQSISIRKPTFCLMFDVGNFLTLNENGFYQLLSDAALYGIKMGFAVLPELISNSQCKQFCNTALSQGHEILIHTPYSENLAYDTALTSTQINNYLKSYIATFKENGFDPKGLVIAGGQDSCDLVRNEIKKFFYYCQSLKNTSWGSQISPYNTWNDKWFNTIKIRRNNIEEDNVTLEDIKASIDAGIANNGLTVLYAHNYNTYSGHYVTREVFKGMLEYIQTFGENIYWDIPINAIAYYATIRHNDLAELFETIEN